MQMDPLADAMSTLKNAELAGELDCELKPASKLIGEVLRVMQEEGYIDGFEYVDNDRGGKYDVDLAGKVNECRAVKPRFEATKDEFEKWEKKFLPARNFGSLIVTTSSGVMSHREAKEKGIGGQLLACVY